MTIDRRATPPAAAKAYRAALLRTALTAGLLAATPAHAAQDQAAQQTPPPPRGLESLSPQAVPVPPAPVIVLPEASRSPSRPQTRPQPRTQTPTETPTRARPTPDRATSEPRTTPAPATSRPTPAAPVPGASAPATPPEASVQDPSDTRVETLPAPEAAVPTTTPTEAPTTTAEPAPTGATLSAPETGRSMPLWLWLAVIVVVVAGLWALTRRRAVPPEHHDDPVPAPTPAPAPVPAPAPEPAASPAAPPVMPPAPAPVVPPVAPAAPVAPPAAPRFLDPVAPRARLSVELRPLRAGLNLLSAVADCELVVTNTGAAPATSIRVGVSLLTAHGALDADLAALTAAPIGRPAVPPFTLAPGETRTLKAIAATPRDAIRTMTAANRPMFVPIVAVNVLYPDGQTTRAWAIGVERVDSAKLAPFWLDAPAKMYADIGARPHAAAFEK